MVDCQRLDVALAQRGLVQSRSRARELIQTGGVLLNGTVCQKCAAPVTPEDRVELLSDSGRFVSRGGYKLLKAIETFALDLHDAVAMDLGASTGGFTDCMLQHGAKTVYAVDVGTDQLAPVLRADPRVICLEQCNARYLTPQQIPEPMDFISADVSFISLTKILPVIKDFLKPDGRAVCLIKPQFEAGAAAVGKNGVVRDPAAHVRVLRDVTDYMIGLGFTVMGMTFSPIKGPKGNIEYLALLAGEQGSTGLPVAPEALVKAAHEALEGERV